jgi:glutathione S-transferase
MLTTLLALCGSAVSHEALKLSYFDARGAAETTRVLLAIAGVKYEDKRFAIGPGMAAPEFKEAKESGRLVANLGRVPILAIEGEGEIGQSKAMERFVARQYAMFGANEFEACKIDAIAEHCRDIKDAQRAKGFSRFSQKPDEEKAAARKEWFEEGLPSWLDRLEQCIASYSGAAGCAVGTALSYADVCLWGLLRECPEDEAAETAKAAAGCTRLNAIADAVAAHPNVAAWIRARPPTAF